MTAGLCHTNYIPEDISHLPQAKTCSCAQHGSEKRHSVHTKSSENFRERETCIQVLSRKSSVKKATFETVAYQTS